VRKAAYNAVLSGAFGHTYGCRDVWYFYEPTDAPARKDVKTHWRRAMDFPGAWQIGYLRTLLTDYPWHQLEPDRPADGRQIVVRGSGSHGTYVPAAVSRDRRVVVAYIPEPMPIWVNAACLGVSRKVTARWFDPRTGQYRFERVVSPEADSVRFDPPEGGPDWVLILERGR
jgi:hypothetical protein